MSEIFISYSSEDRGKAKDIAEALVEQGFSVWWDRSILPGETFDTVIEEALDAAKCVIVLWSRTSVSSKWVKTEASEGDRRGILIPVLIDDVKIPLAFRRMQAADLKDWVGKLPHPGFDNLLKAVAGILGRPRAVQPSREIKADEAAKKRREEEERLRREQEKRERRAREEAEEREREEQERLRREEEERKEREREAREEQERKRQEQERLYREEEEKKARERKAREEAEKRKREEQERPKTFTNSIGMKFTLIPAGEFYMGSEELDDEKPVHKVKINNPFYLGTYLVTQREWKAIMGDNPSGFKGDDLPVENVSWDNVQEFIKKLSEKEGTDKYRLPSEAEWEYACRAGTIIRYSFGDSESKLGGYAWYDNNSDEKTHPVGQRKPNPWGLYDMHGNVWEWVQDVYHKNYDGAPTDGSAWESGDGARRVFRGGSWYYDARLCRSAIRASFGPRHRSSSLGFRLLQEL